MKDRVYYLDWLRFFLIVSLVPFHVADYYAHTTFALRTEMIDPILNIIYQSFTQWRLALLFFISGVFSQMYLDKHGKMKFFKNRFMRIYVPLNLGIIFLIPPQVYIERITKDNYQQSLFDFYLTLFNGIYPQGNFSWGHLWFLFYLFVFMLLLILIYKKNNNNKYVVPICMITPIVAELVLRKYFPGYPSFIGDYCNIIVFACYFLLGTTYFSSIFWQQIHSYDKFLLPLTFIITVLVPTMEINHHSFGYNFLFALRTLLLIIILPELFKKYFSFRNRFVEYIKDASYSYYILHHTIIIVLAYYTLKLFDPLNFFLITTILSIILIQIIYELVKRVPYLRLLIGLKAKN